MVIYYCASEQRVPWESTNIRGCCQDYSQIECLDLMLKITPTQLIDHGQVELEHIHLWSQYQKRKVNTKPAINPLIEGSVLPVRYTMTMVAQSLWEGPTDI